MSCLGLEEIAGHERFEFRLRGKSESERERKVKIIIKKH
jgi:hypothetical protein